MSKVFFEELDIPSPDHHLEVGSGLHGEQTGKMLARLEQVLISERPDWVLIYGDTNSTLAGALAASKLHIPVAHVEAGLRSFNRRMPEEINRIVADHLSSVLFCPTRGAIENLRREGIGGVASPFLRVYEVPDVMQEAMHLALPMAATKEGLIAEMGLRPGHYWLATIHRAETTDDPARLRAAVELLSSVSQLAPVVLPLHPRTCKLVEAARWAPPSGVHLLKPVGYLQMLALERHARAILTDSGGVQKEAFWLGVPCLTLRAETEWVETVAAGMNHLVNLDAALAASLLSALPTDRPPRLPMPARASGPMLEKLLQEQRSR
jgi:UDP-N-acetylglucosamine 2-epimerase